MNKRIVLSALIILAVIALTATAIWAYFSGTRSESTTITTATIGIGGTENFPLLFTNMLPGETQSREVWIQNGGSRPADFYGQLIGDVEGFNFCFDTTDPLPGNWVPREVLTLTIYDLDVGGPWYTGSVCPLYPGQTSSIIVPMGGDVDPGAWRHLRIDLTLAATAGNVYQGASNTDVVHLIAVQYNGPAPAPDKQGFPQSMNPWPLDTHAPDDDLNYP